MKIDGANYFDLICVGLAVTLVSPDAIDETTNENAVTIQISNDV